MLADLIREFGKEKNYEVYENYSRTVTTPIGDETYTTLGIVVKQDCNPFEVLAELTSFLDTKELNAQVFDELEGYSFDVFGPGSILYFPMIRDYQPLQP